MARFDLEQQIGTKVNKENIHEIIANEKFQKPFLKYCKEVASKTIKRNKEV